MIRAVDDTYTATGCPGGPGHPSAVSMQMASEAADALVDAAHNLKFDSEFRPQLLTMCQCNLAEIIFQLTHKLAATKQTTS